MVGLARRGVGLGALLLVLLLPGSAAGAAATESAGWQVDAGHSGYVYGAGVVPPLTPVWSISTPVQNPVAIDGGHLFAMTYPPVAGTNSTSADLEEIDLASGAVIWNQQLSPQSGSNYYLALDGGKVLVAGAYQDSQGNDALEAWGVDEGTGKILWNDTSFSQWWPSPPEAANGTLYFEASGVGGTVYAIRESDGQLLWSTPLFSGSPATLADGMVVIAEVYGVAEGLDQTTGQVVWQDSGYNHSDGGGTAMSSFDGTHVWGDIFTTADKGAQESNLYDPKTGAVAAQIGGYPPAFGYGEAVQLVTTNSGEVGSIQAIDPATGDVRWSMTEPAGSGPLIGSEPLLADGYVFAEGPQGNLWAFDPCSGKIVWQTTVNPTNRPFSDDPLPSLSAGDGYLVVPDASGIAVFKGSGPPPAQAPSCEGTGSSSSATGNPPSGSTTTTTSNPSPAPPSGDTPASASAATTASKTTSAGQPAVPVATERAVASISAMHVACKFHTGFRKLDACVLTLRSGIHGWATVRLSRGRRIMSSWHARLVPGVLRLTLHLTRPIRLGLYQLTVTVGPRRHALSVVRLVHVT